jgi:uncharacterized membrane protein YagU involved in acid resistance
MAMQWSTRSAILIAITFAYSQGVPPLNLLQTVASGVLGKASYEGGVGAAALGLALHFLISLLLAAAYVLASRRVEALTKHAVVAGVVFGIGVFLLMRLVVLPLSAFPHPVTFRPLASVLDLLSHMFLFGVPIALAARKAWAPPREPVESSARMSGT